MKQEQLTIIGINSPGTVTVSFRKLRQQTTARGRKLNAYTVIVDDKEVGQVFQQEVSVDGPKVGRHVVVSRRTVVEWGHDADAAREFPYCSYSARNRTDAVARLLGGSTAIRENQ